MDFRFPSGLGPRKQEVLLKRSRSLGLFPQFGNDAGEEGEGGSPMPSPLPRGLNERVEGGWGFGEFWSSVCFRTVFLFLSERARERGPPRTIFFDMISSPLLQNAHIC